MNQIYYSKVDDYIAGKLKEVEVVDFEREMSVDPELRKEVELSRVLSSALNEEDVVSLRDKLIKAKSDVERRRYRINYKWLAAASFMLIIGVSFLLWQSKPSSPEKLFDEYYQRFEVPSLNRGASEVDGFNQIVSKYRNGESEKILPVLEKMYDQSIDDNFVELMLVSIYLESGDAQKAEKIINSRIERDNTNLLADTYQWYLCLSNLKMNKIDKTIDLCRVIEKSESKYAPQALKIRESLIKTHK